LGKNPSGAALDVTPQRPASLAPQDAPYEDAADGGAADPRSQFEPVTGEDDPSSQEQQGGAYGDDAGGYDDAAAVPSQEEEITAASAQRGDEYYGDAAAAQQQESAPPAPRPHYMAPTQRFSKTQVRARLALCLEAACCHLVGNCPAGLASVHVAKHY